MPRSNANRRSAATRSGGTVPLNGSARNRRRRGQALVELALILPVMIVLFASALDLGRLYYSQVTINNAAKEGALEAANLNPVSFDNTQPCNGETNPVICLVVNEAKGSLISIAPGDVALVCNPSPCPATPVMGNTVKVTVGADFALFSPILSVFFGGQTVPIAASSVAQLGVEPNPGGAPGATPTPGPTPTPTPTPVPTPTPDPSASPTPTPEPSPTPVCVTPDVTGNIIINPGAGQSVLTGTGTVFTMTAPSIAPQPGCSFVYTWSFGDGASGSGPSVTHQYQKKGPGASKEYTVTLAISTVGVPQTWTDTRNVKVNP
jgi:cell division septation protein DedD